jgi:hypothetical protein
MKSEIANLKSKISLVECPRDAMQGWPHFIPTQKKIQYINALLKVGFDIIDFGSFVSPKAIPQMADTKDVNQNCWPSLQMKEEHRMQWYLMKSLTSVSHFLFLKLFNCVIPIQPLPNH